MFVIPYYTMYIFFLFKRGYTIALIILWHYICIWKKKDLKEKTINTNKNKGRPIRSKNKNTCICFGLNFM